MTTVKPRILIIDDEAGNINVLAEYLVRDYTVLAAKDGQRGLELASGNEKPSLILLDIIMLDMDGYEVCRRLKRHKDTRNIPVIFITTMDHERGEEFGLRVGAVDYITKPFNPAIVMARIRTHIELSQHQTELEQLVEERTKELSEISQTLKKSNNLKQNFLNSISHELRTPMNGIYGCLDMASSYNEFIKDGAKERPFCASDAENVYEKVNYTLQAGRQSASELMQVIEDILLFSELQSSSLVLEQQPFDFQTMSQELALSIAERCEAKGIDFQYNIPTDIGYLNGDQRYLRLVLVQMLKNALKFTPRGSIRLDVKKKPLADNPEDITLQLIISDSGIGISEEDLGKIFDPFRQLDTTYSRSYGGMGNGLSICQELVGMMGGEIVPNSQLNKGSQFIIKLPYTTINQEQLKDVRQDNITEFVNIKRGNRNMLIVEDNRVNQMILEHVLTKLGFEVSVAENGVEALKKSEQGDFAAILMDCQMPLMDGFEATRQIRLSKGINSDIPIIAVTANAMSGDRQVCLNAGMNDYLAKPVKEEQMQRCLDLWLSK